METTHNPDRLISDLRQILSQGRKRIGLLIGAGAPLSVKSIDPNNPNETKPLIPGIEELTRLALINLSAPQVQAVEAIKVGIGAGANIESILSRIRLLEQALDATPINGLDGPGYSELGKAICQNIGGIVGANLPSGPSAYTELISWISGTIRKHAVEIFTTNYDLLIEEAFERTRAPYFDGFSGGHAPFFDAATVASDDLPARWSRLWKLHGSIGWALENGLVVRGRGKSATQLVYPDHLKYDLTQKQPYAALFERLKNFLLTPDTLLLTIGFSFRDTHICAVLDESLAMNANTAVFAFQYQTLETEKESCLLAHDRPNLTVYAADGAVVNGISGKWRLGELPKNWIDIRASFWGTRGSEAYKCFLLGDFNYFARFCALTHAANPIQDNEIVQSREESVVEDAKS